MSVSLVIVIDINNQDHNGVYVSWALHRDKTCLSWAAVVFPVDSSCSFNKIECE